jgi:FkbM family methyltransferase
MAPHLSSAQTGEDLLLLFYINSLGLRDCTWLDIGAHHPRFMSNTRLLYDLGMHGINVEGDPTLMGPFHKERPRDVNLNVLVSDKTGTETFHLIEPSTLNTISLEEASKYESMGYSIRKRIQVASLTIPDLLDEYCGGIFPDLLLVDAEGHDFEILRMIRWEESAPKIICIEIGEHSPTIKDNFLYLLDHEITNYLGKQGYFVAGYTYNNTIFIRRDLCTRPSDALLTETPATRP